MNLQVTKHLKLAVKQYLVLSLASIVLPTVAANGQMINTSMPFTTVSDSFYENHGVNFGFTLPGGRGNGSRIVGLDALGNQPPNLSFSQGGSSAATPVFGGYNPATAGTFGFGVRNPNGGGFSLGLSLAKGRNRQSITTAPSLTTQNGYGGGLSTGSVRPFVTGVIPIVGHGGAPIMPMSQDVYVPDNAVTRAMNSGQLKLGPSQPRHHVASNEPVTYSNPESTATTGDMSVSAIKAEREKKLLAEQRRLESMMDEARKLESEKKFVESSNSVSQSSWRNRRRSDEGANQVVDQRASKQGLARQNSVGMCLRPEARVVPINLSTY